MREVIDKMVRIWVGLEIKVGENLCLTGAVVKQDFQRICSGISSLIAKIE